MGGRINPAALLAVSRWAVSTPRGVDYTSCLPRHVAGGAGVAFVRAGDAPPAINLRSLSGGPDDLIGKIVAPAKEFDEEEPRRSLRSVEGKERGPAPTPDDDVLLARTQRITSVSSHVRSHSQRPKERWESYVSDRLNNPVPTLRVLRHEGAPDDVSGLLKRSKRIGIQVRRGMEDEPWNQPWNPDLAIRSKPSSDDTYMRIPRTREVPKMDSADSLRFHPQAWRSSNRHPIQDSMSSPFAFGKVKLRAQEDDWKEREEKESENTQRHHSSVVDGPVTFPSGWSRDPQVRQTLGEMTTELHKWQWDFRDDAFGDVRGKIEALMREEEPSPEKLIRLIERAHVLAEKYANRDHSSSSSSSSPSPSSSSSSEEGSRSTDSGKGGGASDRHGGGDGQGPGGNQSNAMWWLLKGLLTVGAGAVVGLVLGIAGSNGGDWVQTHFDLASIAMPIFRTMDPDSAHNQSIWLAQWCGGVFVPVDTRPTPAILRTTVWGKQFANPIGLAAGYDKNAQVMQAMLGLGFGFVEVGSITPKAQEGNPKPRLFRVPSERAIINRCGCNSDGSEAVAARIAAFRDSHPAPSSSSPSSSSSSSSSSSRGVSVGEGRGGGQMPSPGVLGINIAKNRTSTDAVQDYITSCTAVGAHADYVVINVSSPNTPGLRNLQAGRELAKIVRGVKRTLAVASPGTPLVVKVAPDLDDATKRDIARVALRHGVDGLIVSNTTVARTDAVLSHPSGGERGGMSGKPLRDKSTELVAEMYRLTRGRIPIIGCGGVSSGLDAFEKIAAGASLVQLYTSLTYEGPAVVPKIKDELARILEDRGFTSVAEAVGCGFRRTAGA